MTLQALPNLNALRVFSVVARTQSFTQAADALGVTQSAVSKQIATLEQQLGKALVVRQHRRIELTPFGKGVAHAATSGFEQMQMKLAALDRSEHHQIRLCGDADFVQLWLFPRLPSFEKAHPKIRISITVAAGLNWVPAADFDFAVIWGRGDWQGCQFEPLLRNTVFPVAAPGFFGDLGRAPRMSDIVESQLIHDQTRFWWRAFRDASGDAGFDPSQGRLYNQTVLCLEAAARGDGVTIGDEVSARYHLETKRLECPMPERLPSPDAYYVASPAGQMMPPEQLAFRQWLKAEVEEHTNWYQEFWAGR